MLLRQPKLTKGFLPDEKNTTHDLHSVQHNRTYLPSRETGLLQPKNKRMVKLLLLNFLLLSRSHPGGALVTSRLPECLKADPVFITLKTWTDCCCVGSSEDGHPPLRYRGIFWHSPLHSTYGTLDGLPACQEFTEIPRTFPKTCLIKARLRLPLRVKCLEQPALAPDSSQCQSLRGGDEEESEGRG